MTNFSKEFPQYYCPICKVYQIFKNEQNNKYKCMNCQKYTLKITKDWTYWQKVLFLL